MSEKGERYSVIVSDAATQMLVAHARFLARVSENAARSLVAEFSEKAKSLEGFPERNPWLTDPLIPNRKYRKLLMANRYLIVHQVVDSDVFVVAVVDCRQDYGWLL